MYEFAAAYGLVLSFQRYPYPPAGIVGVLPASHGALPLHATGEGRLIMPSPDGEAFWIALLCGPDAAPAVVRILASTRAGPRLDVLGGLPAEGPVGAAAVVLPPHRFIEGISRSDGGWWPLARHAPRRESPSCEGLDLLVCAGPGAILPGAPPELPPDAGSAGPTRYYAPAEAAPNSSPLPGPGMLNPCTPGCTGAVQLRIDLLGGTAFTAASGLPVPPLAPDSVYDGRRLP